MFVIASFDLRALIVCDLDSTKCTEIVRRRGGITRGDKISPEICAQYYVDKKSTDCTHVTCLPYPSLYTSCVQRGASTLDWHMTL